jgi:hypothetical protein
MMTTAMIMMAMMMMMVSSGHLEAKLGEKMNQRHSRPQTTILMGEMQKRLTGMVSWMRAQLEVRIVEIVPQRLVMEVFEASKHQRTMVTFPVVMTKVTAKCATEMMMTTTAMYRTEMMRRLPTSLHLHHMSHHLQCCLMCLLVCCRQ